MTVKPSFLSYIISTTLPISSMRDGDSLEVRHLLVAAAKPYAPSSALLEAMVERLECLGLYRCGLIHAQVPPLSELQK